MNSADLQQERVWTNTIFTQRASLSRGLKHATTHCPDTASKKSNFSELVYATRSTTHLAFLLHSFGRKIPAIGVEAEKVLDIYH
jgi:hypothetical protein